MYYEKDAKDFKVIPLFISIIVFLFCVILTPSVSFAAEATTIAINMPLDMKYATPIGAPDQKVYVKKSNGVEVAGSFALQTGAALLGENAGIYLFVNKNGDFDKDSITVEKLFDAIKLSDQNINYQANTFKMTVTDNLVVNSYPNRVFAVICDDKGNIEGTETFFICIDAEQMTFDVTNTTDSVSIKVNETTSGVAWNSAELIIDGSSVSNYTINDFEKVITYISLGIGSSSHNYSILLKDNAGYEYRKTWQYPESDDETSGEGDDNTNPSDPTPTPTPTSNSNVVEENIVPGKEVTIQIKDRAGVIVPAGTYNEVIKLSIEETGGLTGVVQQNNIKLALTSGIFEFTAKASDGTAITEFKKPLTIKIKINKDKLKDSSDIPSIYYWNKDREQWIYIGGKYNSETAEVEAQVNHFTKFAVFTSDYGFNDIEKNYAKNSIIKLGMMGVFDQNESGLFKPSEIINRREFIISLVKALGLPLEEIDTLNFTDDSKIPKEDKPYYAAAQKARILSGIPDGKGVKIGAERSITREEVAVLLAKLIKSDSTYELKYKDLPQISKWADNAVKLMKEKGIMNGYGDNIFGPKRNISRAEVAIVVDKIITLFGV